MQTLPVLALALALATSGCTKDQPDATTPADEPPEAPYEPIANEAPAPVPGTADDESPATTTGVEAMSDDEIAEAMIAFVEEMGAIGQRLGEDCNGIAAEWEALFDDNDEVLREAKRRGDEIETDPARKQAFEERYDERMKQAAMGLIGTAMACAENEDIKALMERFD